MRASKIRVYEAFFNFNSKMLHLRHTRLFYLAKANYADLDELLRVVGCKPKGNTSLDAGSEEFQPATPLTPVEPVEPPA